MLTFPISAAEKFQAFKTSKATQHFGNVLYAHLQHKCHEGDTF